MQEHRALAGGGKVQFVHVIGERNSGTNWLETVLRANYQAPVHDSFCSFKHWAQFPCHPKEAYVTVVLLRNPYDWAASFYTKPYNSPAHQKLTFKAFLRKPWALNPNHRPSNFGFTATYRDPAGHDTGRLHRVAHDQGAQAPPHNAYPAGGACGDKQKAPSQAWLRSLPADWCGRIPVYESRPDSGRAFGGLLQMRGWKLRNFLGVKDWARPGSVEVTEGSSGCADGCDGGCCCRRCCCYRRVRL